MRVGKGWSIKEQSGLMAEVIPFTTIPVFRPSQSVTFYIGIFKSGFVDKTVVKKRNIKTGASIKFFGLGIGITVSRLPIHLIVSV